MTQLTFANGVLRLVSEFRAAQRDFSARDVTVEFRNRVNKGEWELTDATKELVDGSPTFRIDHENVRALVLSLYENGFLPNYNKTYGRANGVSYTLYQCVCGTGTTSTNAATVSVTTGSSQQTGVARCAKSGQPLTINLLTQTPLPGMIAGYIQRKRAKGQNATLKSVQSRFKKLQLSTKQISNIVTAKGYQVSPVAGKKPSLSIIS